jgi:hypothetical protein
MQGTDRARRTRRAAGRTAARRPGRGGARRGVALVTVLALVALASALLAGTFASATALARRAREARAIARADAAPRRALAALAATAAAPESLAVGAWRELSLPAMDADSAPPLRGRARLRRLTATLSLLFVDVHVGEDRTPLARRRYQLLLERRADGGAVDDAGVAAPLLVWAMTEVP